MHRCAALPREVADPPRHSNVAGRATRGAPHPPTAAAAKDAVDEGRDTAAGFAAIVQQLAASAASPEVPGGIGLAFLSAWPPEVIIAEYVESLRQDFRCSAECFVIALVYLDRVIKQHAHITVGPLTVHRLIAASLTLAAKFHDDETQTNSSYAVACGMTPAEHGELERAMLELLHYRLVVSPAVFELYRQLLKAAGRPAHGDAARAVARHPRTSIPRGRRGSDARCSS